MSNYSFSSSVRVSKARAAQQFGPPVRRVLLILGLFLALAAVVLFVLTRSHFSFIPLGLAVMAFTAFTWLTRDLGHLPAAPVGSSYDLAALLPTELVASYHPALTSVQLLQASGVWRHCSRLGIGFYAPVVAVRYQSQSAGRVRRQVLPHPRTYQPARRPGDVPRQCQWQCSSHRRARYRENCALARPCRPAAAGSGGG
jgi:hypothetical protein